MIRWEEGKNPLNNSYFKGFSGEISLFTIFASADPQVDPLHRYYMHSYVVTSDLLYAETPEELKEAAENLWTVWLKKAGIIPLTQDLVEEVIKRIELTAFEEGPSEDDEALRAEIEVAFPAIKERREDKEFNDWLWSEKAEQDPRVEAARNKLALPYYKIKNRGDELINNLMEVKKTVKEELEAGDQESLRNEWRSYQDDLNKKLKTFMEAHK